MAWKAQHRLHARYRHLTAKGKCQTGSRDRRQSRTLGIHLGDRGPGRDTNATSTVSSGVANRDASRHLRNIGAASVVVEGHTDRRTLENRYAAGFRARPAQLANRDASRHLRNIGAASVVVEGHTDRRTLENRYAAGFRAWARRWESDPVAAQKVDHSEGLMAGLPKRRQSLGSARRMLKVDQVHVLRAQSAGRRPLSQRQVAKELGISRLTVKKYLREALPIRLAKSDRPGPAGLGKCRRHASKALLTASAGWTAGKQQLTATRLHQLLGGGRAPASASPS